MKRIRLLKNQLIEAARFTKSSEPDYHRLGLILLDNFIEIQLNILVGDYFNSPYLEKKYGYKNSEIKKARKNFYKLIELSVKLSIIEEEYKEIILFCHQLRNKLYHNTEGAFDIIRLGCFLLFEVIKIKQPQWKSGRMFVSYENEEIYNMSDSNSEESWMIFLDSLITIENSEVQNLLYKSLTNRIDSLLEFYEYIKNDFGEVVRKSKNNNLSEILKHYCFYRKNNGKLKEYLNQSEEIYVSKYAVLLEEFNSEWQNIDVYYFNNLKRNLLNITAQNNIIDSFKEYLLYYNSINRYYSAISEAVQDYNQAVNNAINFSKER